MSALELLRAMGGLELLRAEAAREGSGAVRPGAAATLLMAAAGVVLGFRLACPSSGLGVGGFGV
ncbi:hypothetical protein ACFXEZ_29005, partial [Streptomyces hygroscopicus]